MIATFVLVQIITFWCQLFISADSVKSINQSITHMSWPK